MDWFRSRCQIFLIFPIGFVVTNDISLKRLIISSIECVCLNQLNFFSQCINSIIIISADFNNKTLNFDELYRSIIRHMAKQFKQTLV